MTNETAKRCFGISWSASDPKCAGGPDPTWQNDDGSYVRPKCDYFATCGAKKMAAAQEQRLLQLRAQPTTYAPAQQVPVTQTPTYAAAQPPRYVQPMPHAPAPYYPTAPYFPAGPQQPMNPAHMMIQAPMQIPMQQALPVNYQMPGYLSHPEPYRGSYLGMLGISILRAMLKAAGHTMANVFDAVPFSVRHQQPQQQQQQEEQK